MLPWRQEKSAIYQGVSLKNVHLCVAENTGDSVHLVGGVVGEDETAGLIIPNATLIFHFNVVGVDLSSWENIEGAVITSAEEYASPTVMPRPV